MRTWSVIISEELAKLGRTDIKPSWIEGYMRLQHNTLGSLSPREFTLEVELCVACVDEGGIKAAEQNARSFGLL